MRRRIVWSLAVELSHDKPVELLVVSAAVVSQEPERLLLADEEAADSER